MKAVRRVNEEFAKPTRTIEEADALMAAITCLTAQSSLLPDIESMVEYVTMSRGLCMVLFNLLPDPKASFFKNLVMSEHESTMFTLAKIQGEEDLELMDQFKESVRGVQKLCSNKNELKYADILLQCASALQDRGPGHG